MKANRLTRPRSLLLLILLLGLALRFWVALAFENLLWPDEVFQVLEPAHRLVFSFGSLPLEFTLGLRSWALPGLVAGWLLPFRWFPATTLYIDYLKISLCLFSSVIIIFSYRYGREFGARYAWLLAAVFAAGWYELIYFAPKAFDSVLATDLVFPGLFLAELAAVKKSRGTLLAAGLLLSLGTVCRPQYGLVWLVPLFFLGLDLYYLAPSLIIFLLWGLLDWLTWGAPFYSLYANLNVNLAQNVGKNWGEMPWYFYGQVLWQNLGLFFPLLIAGAALVWRKIPLTVTALCVLVVVHSFVPHKEFRFIFIALPWLLVCGALALARLRNWTGLGLGLLLAAFLANSLFLATGYSLRRLGYYMKDQPAWSAYRANLRAYRFLSGRDDLGGLIDNATLWVWSGGYYYLHRDVPVYRLDEYNEAAIRGNRCANYLLTRQAAVPAEFRLVAAIDGLNVFRRAGKISLDPAYPSVAK